MFSIEDYRKSMAVATGLVRDLRSSQRWKAIEQMPYFISIRSDKMNRTKEDWINNANVLTNSLIHLQSTLATNAGGSCLAYFVREGPKRGASFVENGHGLCLISSPEGEHVKITELVRYLNRTAVMNGVKYSYDLRRVDEKKGGVEGVLHYASQGYQHSDNIEKNSWFSMIHPLRGVGFHELTKVQPKTKRKEGEPFEEFEERLLQEAAEHWLDTFMLIRYFRTIAYLKAKEPKRNQRIANKAERKREKSLRYEKNEAAYLASLKRKKSNLITEFANGSDEAAILIHADESMDRLKKNNLLLEGAEKHTRKKIIARKEKRLRLERKRENGARQAKKILALPKSSQPSALQRLFPFVPRWLSEEQRGLLLALPRQLLSVGLQRLLPLTS